MRCVCCDRMLNDYESTVRLKSTGDFADTCNTCRSDIGNELYEGRTDLEPNASADELEKQADALLGESDELL